MNPERADNFRLSVAERSHALDVLGNHFVEGRLDVNEYNTRSEKVAAAITVGDLSEMFADLPGGVPVELNQQGVLAPRNPGAATTFEDDEVVKELAVVRKKGEAVELFDGILFAVVLGSFFILQFAVGWSMAWVVWPLYGVLLIASRMFFGLDDAEEEAYEELKELESAERSKRFKIAMQKMRELEDRDK